jgi:hypothetical protein
MEPYFEISGRRCAGKDGREEKFKDLRIGIDRRDGSARRATNTNEYDAAFSFSIE